MENSTAFPSYLSTQDRPCRRRCEIGPETPKQEIADLTNEDFGVNTFRLNMCGEKRFCSDADILDAFETIKAVGGVAQVHAESGDVIEREERAMIGRGITGKDGLTDGSVLWMID